MKNGKFETYITFADNRSAALAFTFIISENALINKDLKDKKWFVEPANTWHQPLQTSVTNDLQNSNVMDVDNDDQMKIDIESTLPPILQLNEDCFDRLFKFCGLESLINLSQVCKTFNILVGVKGSNNRYFRRFNTLTIFVSDFFRDDNYTTLGIARKKMIRTGKTCICLRQFNQFMTCASQRIIYPC